MVKVVSDQSHQAECVSLLTGLVLGNQTGWELKLWSAGVKRGGELVGGVEVPERSVVQLVPTNLEIPLWAVEGVRREIVESLHGMHEGGRAVHVRCETYGISAGDVLPLFTKTLFIQKHHCKILDGMLFHVAVLESGAAPECC